MSYRVFPVILLVGVSLAQAAHPHPVDARLLADISTLKPGATFTLGVLMKIPTGRHIYWQNPGDSGSPTRVKWTSTPALQFHPLQYPTPAILTDPGNLVSYGYQDQVMLLAKVTTPATLPSGSTVKINAEVEWLLCKEICTPGSATLSIDLPVGAISTPANEKLFADWTGRMPHPVKEPAISSKQSQTGRVYEVRFHNEQIKTTAHFAGLAPGPESALVVKDVQYQNKDGDVQLRFVLQPLQGQKIEAKTLPILLIYDESTGRRSFRLDVPLQEFKGETL